jgi:hypothetical protein
MHRLVEKLMDADPAKRPTALQSQVDYFESASDEDVRPTHWDSKSDFDCVELVEDENAFLDWASDMMTTAKELPTTSDAHSMKRLLVHRVVRIENRILFEDYHNERSKIAQRLAKDDGREQVGICGGEERTLLHRAHTTLHTTSHLNKNGGNPQAEKVTWFFSRGLV